MTDPRDFDVNAIDELFFMPSSWGLSLQSGITSSRTVKQTRAWCFVTSGHHWLKAFILLEARETYLKVSFGIYAASNRTRYLNPSLTKVASIASSTNCSGA